MSGILTSLLGFKLIEIGNTLRLAPLTLVVTLRKKIGHVFFFNNAVCFYSLKNPNCPGPRIHSI